MKKIFAISILLSAFSLIIYAQEKPTVPDSTLLKKYEALKENLKQQVEKLADAKAKYLGEYLEKNNKLVTTYNTIEALAAEERQRLNALNAKKENTHPSYGGIKEFNNKTNEVKK